MRPRLMPQRRMRILDDFETQGTTAYGKKMVTTSKRLDGDGARRFRGQWIIGGDSRLA